MNDHDIVIIGSGFGGIGLGVRLKQQQRDFVILEQAGEVGGVWRENRYPGAACDVPSHLYSFSFARHYPWQRRFAGQEEIHDYLRDCCPRFGLMPHLRFGQQVSEARFLEDTAQWLVTTATGQQYRCRMLVTATGQLSLPAIPALPGRERFAGRQFHSAQWPHPDQLDGQRVVVVGTGASAIQFIPAIANRVQSLTVLQRSAPYVIRKPDHAYGRLRRWLFRHFPALVSAHRAWIYTLFEHRVPGFQGRAPWVMALLEWNFRRLLRRQVADPALRARLQPDYPMGCKRILLSNDYYPALCRPHVRVETTPVGSIEPAGIRLADGRLLPADTLIYGTGFQATRFLSPIRVIGRGGRLLHDTWQQGAEAYLGTTVHGYPNLFMLYGPNTNLGHNSIIYMLESQFAYIGSAARHLLDTEMSSMEVRQSVQQDYNSGLQTRLSRSVWQQGCHSWYTTESGRNTNNWPGFTFVFRHKTRRIELDDYDCH